MKFSNLIKIILLKFIGLLLFLNFLVLVNPAQDKSSKGKLRVLFVGNSLTYSNNLPEIIASLARSAKQKKLDYKMIAYPNFSLEDHWNKGEVQKILAKEKWDYVIMQQGPSASSDGRQVLVDYAKKYAEPIAQAGAKSAFYMVWSAAGRIRDFAGVSATYQAAAKEVGGLFFPAGEAWLEAWRRDPKIELYAADRFHPNFAGSYLAALIIYQQLYHQSPIGLTRQFRFSFEETSEIPEKQAKILQEAAAETNKKYGFE
ncbi:MAG TPA: hypothetical protein PKY82_21970 [Pyrinomonadaceae bacterium]|nr:hypothetical protein [Pyrinomonadaceae bacterium]